jgi:hypothetical protein
MASRILTTRAVDEQKDGCSFEDSSGKIATFGDFSSKRRLLLFESLFGIF